MIDGEYCLCVTPGCDKSHPEEDGHPRPTHYLWFANERGRPNAKRGREIWGAPRKLHDLHDAIGEAVNWAPEEPLVFEDLATGAVTPAPAMFQAHPALLAHFEEPSDHRRSYCLHCGYKPTRSATHQQLARLKTLQASAPAGTALDIRELDTGLIEVVESTAEGAKRDVLSQDGRILEDLAASPSADSAGGGTGIDRRDATAYYSARLDLSSATTLAKTLTSVATDARGDARGDALRLEDEARDLRHEAALLDEKEGLRGAGTELVREATRREEDAEHRRGLAAEYDARAAQITS